MPTSDEWVNAALKRFLSQNRIQNELIDYLKGLTIDLGSRIFPSSGLFTYPVTITYGSGVFSLSIAPSGTIYGADSLGHTIGLTTTRQSNIDFEDDGTNTYWIGMKYIEIPNGIYDNPRTGLPEYDKWMEEVGERDNPNSVADGGSGTIILNVNDIFESGVDHSGRTVRVWLENPMSGDVAVAFEDCTVAYSSPNNTITTSGSLGQGTISTLPADYQVACLGVTVRESATNPFSDEYILLGNIDSSQTAPAGVTDSSLQLDLSGGGGHSLQAAYDGASGSGSGRTVTVDDEAINLTQTNDTIRANDIMQAALRIRKDDDKSLPDTVSYVPEDWEVGIDILTRMMSTGGLVHRVNLMDLSGSDFLRGEEDVDVTSAGDTIDFTRTPAGVDLDFTGEEASIMPNIDMVELYDSTAGNDGVYIVGAVPSATSLDLLNLDRTTAALAQEVSTALGARIYRPVVRTNYGLGNSMDIIGTQDFWEDDSKLPSALSVIVPNNSEDTAAIARFARDDGTGAGTDRQVKILADGSISADGNIIVDSSHDFQYDAARTFYIRMNPEDGMSQFDETNDVPYWKLAVSTSWRLECTDDAQRRVLFSIHVPAGCTIVDIDLLVTANTPSAIAMNATSYYVTHNYSSPATGTPQSIDTQNAVGSGIQVINLDTNIVPSTANHYYVELTSSDNGTGELFHGMRITCEVTDLRPAN